jgi:hypothetical protein
MNVILILGIALVIVGYIWSYYENYLNSEYWVLRGMSRSTYDIISMLTFIVYPGAYLLILFSSSNFLLNIIILLILHFIFTNNEGLIGYILRGKMIEKYKRSINKDFTREDIKYMEKHMGKNEI